MSKTTSLTLAWATMFALISGPTLGQVAENTFLSKNIDRDQLAAQLADIAYEKFSEAKSLLEAKFPGRFDIIDHAPQNPNELGFRALSVKDTQSGNVFVVYAGTDDIVDGIADIELFEEAKNADQLPKSVWSIFPSVVLDNQIAQATSFFDRTRTLKGNDQLFVVGHSLGGLLAEIVGGVRSATSISFSAPGAPDSLLFRHGINVNQSFDAIDYSRLSDPIGSFGIHLGATVRMSKAEGSSLNYFNVPKQHSISVLSQELAKSPSGVLVQQAARPRLDQSVPPKPEKETSPKSEIDPIEMVPLRKDEQEADFQDNQDLKAITTNILMPSLPEEAEGSAAQLSPEGKIDSHDVDLNKSNDDKTVIPAQPTVQPEVNIYIDSWTQQQWEEREFRAYEIALQRKYSDIKFNVDPVNPAVEKDKEQTPLPFERPDVDPWRDKDPTDLVSDVAAIIAAVGPVSKPNVDPLPPGVIQPEAPSSPTPTPDIDSSGGGPGSVLDSGQSSPSPPSLSFSPPMSAPEAMFPSGTPSIERQHVIAPSGKVVSNCSVSSETNSNDVTGLALAADTTGTNERVISLVKPIEKINDGHTKIKWQKTDDQASFLVEFENIVRSSTYNFVIVDDMYQGIVEYSLESGVITDALNGAPIFVVNPDDNKNLKGFKNIVMVKPDIDKYVKRIIDLILEEVKPSGAIVLGIDKKFDEPYSVDVIHQLVIKLDYQKMNSSWVDVDGVNAYFEFKFALGEGRNVLVTDNEHFTKSQALAKSTGLGPWSFVLVEADRNGASVFGPNMDKASVDLENLEGDVRDWTANTAVRVAHGATISFGKDEESRTCNIWRE